VALETLYSIEQAAEKLGGVSPWSIQSWLSQGRLRRTKVGRRTMISESELERFIEKSNSTEPRDGKTR
jgi:excisionase family DNA binding protein